jgi:hypothetical protein
VILQKETEAFFSLLRAGLWEDLKNNASSLTIQAAVDWERIYQLAEEQSVLGVVLAGIEHSEVKPPQEMLLQWIGVVQMFEQQNKAMNQFIAKVIEKLRREDVYTILLKGQGVAQCYERPLWRSCGDVDLLLSDSNYKKAKNVLIPWASSVEPESIYGKHLGLTIDSWAVELHGTQHTELSYRIDKVIDAVQDNQFCQRNVRSWSNGKTQIFLPSPDNDVFFIFTHFLKHFYKGGLGLRQICDWCRLLWTYKELLNRELLESRIRKAGLMTEWMAFGAFAVEYLGIPSEAIPFYSTEKKWLRKAKRIQEFVMRVGNMGHNRDNDYYGNYPFVVRKCISFGRRLADVFNHVKIFPIDSIRFFPSMVFNGLKLAAKGVG